ncbi:MAG: pyruvate, phosphate dikinase, partial [Christensenellaceae bacterium]|nr:pyruvate, phosphate dikinase [Christensenellaceae bacterium]
MANQFVYHFEKADASDKVKFGGKGANLAGMTQLGIPVPPGFTISTEACHQYYKDGASLSKAIFDETLTAVKVLEKKLGKEFGSSKNPLLVSVRSGAPASMPGMMDTILNLGLTDASVIGLAESSENPRFAYDSYRRFIQMYSDVVEGLSKHTFEKIIAAFKKELGIVSDLEFTAENFKTLAVKFKDFFKKEKGFDFPQDPVSQLKKSIEAVFASWNNERAIIYRRMNNIPSSWGTAVNVQSMVFGNFGNTSGTGVCFSRDPATGENVFYGEYLLNAQGEDVVAGVRTPEPISNLARDNKDAFDQLYTYAKNLEKHFKNVQDMEFTIEKGKLFMLQTRNGKRTGHAAVRIAVEMEKEGIISKNEALMQIEAKQLDELLHPVFDKGELKKAKKLAQGLGASPGAAVGKPAFSAEEAKERREKGEKVILVRLETSPDDLAGMSAAQGILTVLGGRTSHAAVGARGMGKCGVCGCGALIIDSTAKTVKIGDRTFGTQDIISIDGSTG